MQTEPRRTTGQYRLPMVTRLSGNTRFDQRRAGEDQRQQHDSGDEEDHVEHEGQGPGPHNAALARPCRT